MERDPYIEGLAAGWKVIDASRLETDAVFEADVAIVGTGAGGAVAGEILADAGLRVVLIEEGPLRTQRDFRMREAEAYPQLYQESAARKSADKAINILQGRCVGGSTTVNWASSFRTPDATLAFWQSRYGLADLNAEALAPWFARMEERLAVRPWPVEPNENNAVLARGGAKLGIPVHTISRNVRGCWNLGYCGMGCPTNAKQSMLVTTIPGALARGATLVTRARALRLAIRGGRCGGVDCVAMDGDGIHAGTRRLTVRARHVVAAAGAIGTPALLMRSDVPDPHGQLGRRTFLHPTVVSAALFEQPMKGYSGAPQSLYSDHFLEQHAIDGPLGFKLEAPPLHPVLFSTTLHGFGRAHAGLMAQFAHAQALIALLRDGFHSDSPGGRVSLRGDGTPVLDYPLTPAFWEGARRALLAMAQIQFAAGAQKVWAVHEQCHGWSNWADARHGIGELPLVPFQTRIVSAHVMGGCAMSADGRAGVVDSNGRHHQIEGLSVLDGSLFPTSVGANPQLSIYALVARNASRLAGQLAGRKPG